MVEFRKCFSNFMIISKLKSGELIITYSKTLLIKNQVNVKKSASQTYQADHIKVKTKNLGYQFWHLVSFFFYLKKRNAYIFKL